MANYYDIYLTQAPWTYVGLEVYAHKELSPTEHHCLVTKEQLKYADDNSIAYETPTKKGYVPQNVVPHTFARALSCKDHEDKVKIKVEDAKIKEVVKG